MQIKFLRTLLLGTCVVSGFSCSPCSATILVNETDKSIPEGVIHVLARNTMGPYQVGTEAYTLGDASFRSIPAHSQEEVSFAHLKDNAESYLKNRPTFSHPASAVWLGLELELDNRPTDKQDHPWVQGFDPSIKADLGGAQAFDELEDGTITFPADGSRPHFTPGSSLVKPAVHTVPSHLEEGAAGGAKG